MKILFVGDDWVGSNARSLANGFEQAGHDVVVIDTTSISLPLRLSPPWIYSKIKHQRLPHLVRRVHDRIDQAAATFKPDMLFGFKTINLDQERLLTTSADLHVHYSPDDVANPYNLSPSYLEFESKWDLIVTTKRHNVGELHERGAASVKFVLSAYDPAWHHLSARRVSTQYAVGFIGACRPDRRDSVVRLARRHRGQMLIRGPGWRRVPQLQLTHAAVGGPVYGEHFSATVSTIAANLVFLNSDNRDTHTCRTFEVPAAGGLFVGERTDEHDALFADRKECFLFSDTEELDDILTWCSRNPAHASKVAEAGRIKTVEGRHRYVDRACEIIDALQ